MLYHLELTTLGIGMVRTSLRRWLRENAGQGPRHAQTPRLKDAGDAGHQPTNAKYTTIQSFSQHSALKLLNQQTSTRLARLFARGEKGMRPGTGTARWKLEALTLETQTWTEQV